MKKEKFYPEGNRRFSFRAFTVIELLVVISIIGLLSSIILVATKGAREKARIVSILQFSSSVKHALGADIIGEWTFDNNTFEDSSGNAPDLSCEHGTCNTGVEGIVRNAVDLDEDGCLEIPWPAGITTDAGEAAMEIWIRFDDIPSGYSDLIYWEPFGLSYDSFSEVWQVRIFTENGWCSLAFPADIEKEKWIHFALTYDGSSKVELYVNGKLKGEDSTTCSGALEMSGNGWLEIGYNVDGKVDELRLYESALTSAQIRKLYVEGAEKHGLLAEE